MARTDKIKIRAQSSSFWPWRITYRISPIVTLTYKDVFSTCFCCSTTIATKCYFLQFKEKRTYNGLPDFMTTVAREELNKLSSSITECNVIYLPQVILTSIELSEFVFLCTNAYFPIFFSFCFDVFLLSTAWLFVGNPSVTGDERRGWFCHGWFRICGEMAFYR